MGDHKAAVPSWGIKTRLWNKTLWSLRPSLLVVPPVFSSHLPVWLNTLQMDAITSYKIKAAPRCNTGAKLHWRRVSNWIRVRSENVSHSTSLQKRPKWPPGEFRGLFGTNPGILNTTNHQVFFFFRWCLEKIRKQTAQSFGLKVEWKWDNPFESLMPSCKK